MINNDEIFGPKTLSHKGRETISKISSSLRTKLLLINWQRGSATNWHTNLLGRHLIELIKDTEIKKAIKVFTKSTNYKVWRSNIFYKRSNHSYPGIDWHHDKHFQDSDLDINFNELGNHISVLIAVSDINKETGIFKYIPGTASNNVFIKRNIKPYHLKNKKEHFEPINSNFDYEQNSKTLEINHGNFIIFHSALIHGSYPGKSVSKGRLGIVLRLTKKNIIIPKKLLRNSSTIDL